jgi:hypothetical protein
MCIVQYCDRQVQEILTTHNAPSSLDTLYSIPFFNLRSFHWDHKDLITYPWFLTLWKGGRLFLLNQLRTFTKSWSLSCNCRISIDASGILGLDFVQRYNCLIDLRSNVLCFVNEELPLYIEGQIGCTQEGTEMIMDGQLLRLVPLAVTIVCPNGLTSGRFDLSSA